MRYSFIKVASVGISTKIANVQENVQQIINKVKLAAADNAQIIVFPELTLTGYSCQDLFLQSGLQAEVVRGVDVLCRASATIESLIIVGAPLKHRGRLYNCALIICKGELLAVVPKTSIPDAAEFFEGRYFTSGEGELGTINVGEHCAVFSNKLILEHAGCADLRVACEICEDLWVPVSPSSIHALAGASVICNPSASNDYLGKSEVRRTLIAAHSQKTNVAYIYASVGAGESTADVLYSDYKCIAENGNILNESNYETDIVYAHLDLQALAYGRQMQSAVGANLVNLTGYTYLKFDLQLHDELGDLQRYRQRNPFLDNLTNREQGLREVITLQKRALYKRLQAAKIKDIVLGLSGGLDSTLAALVAYELCQEYPELKLHLISMPCFGTSEQTKGNARLLAEALGLDIAEVDIKVAAQLQMELIGHEVCGDVTYENVQARQRTAILLNTANKVNGLVLGTADLSEIALGFCTYGGDHLSMYNISASIPKTVIRELVAWWGTNGQNPAAESVLLDIVATPISPELLPTDAQGKIQQSTEDIVGNYDVIDYTLYYHLNYQFEQDKIMFLAKRAFAGIYAAADVEKAVDSYFKRFYRNQFKRTCAPDGAKVTCISLSPRSSWRMPSDL